jgi:hypothetical protein
MGITKLSKPNTSTGRLIQQAVRSIRPKTAVGKIGVALGAEIGGAVGDQCHRILGSIVRDSTIGEAPGAGWSGDAHRRARREAYIEQARRMQEEAWRRAQEAYRRAQAAGDGARRASGGPHSTSHGTSRKAASDAHPYYYRGRVVSDYYEVLEVSPKARQSVIEKAYRALMREVHPDLGGDQRKAQLVNEAYEVLRDPASRRVYDVENGLS